MTNVLVKFISDESANDNSELNFLSLKPSDMRKLLLLSALLISALQVYAGENDPQASVTGTPTVGGLFPHFGLGGNSGASIPANNRLIGKTFIQYSNGKFSPVDSITYSYSNGRGSVPNQLDVNNDDHILFDNSTTYEFNTAYWQYENSRKRIQYFADNKVSELIYQKWHTLTSAWKNSERYLYTYDNNGKMHSSLLQMWYGTLWTNNINSVLNYDHNNNIVQMNSSTYNIEFIYDNDNNLIMIEDKTWSQGGGWSNNERKRYTYTGDDVSVYVLEKWVNNAWVYSNKWEYAYDSNDNVISSLEYTWSGIAWQKLTEEAFVYDNNENMLQKTVKKWDAVSGAFINGSMEKRVYNNNNLPTEINSFTWNGAGWVNADGDIIIRYYYEQYFPTNVAAISGENPINLYPVPAMDFVNVNFTMDNRQDVNIAVADVTGRVVYAAQLEKVEHYNNAVSVSNLPAGVYSIKVAGNKGLNMSGKFVVVH